MPIDLLQVIIAVAFVGVCFLASEVVIRDRRIQRRSRNEREQVLTPPQRKSADGRNRPKKRAA